MPRPVRCKAQTGLEMIFAELMAERGAGMLHPALPAWCTEGKLRDRVLAAA